ncbi:hypothetical protein [Lucifera butyrica]|uniref:hypothetical protein n=1 Tax=Lucifera butyrica TaxID=1351585 RepID=UPI000F8717CB|nr:hypothetical protein [Lucifera butyrica]
MDKIARVSITTIITIFLAHHLSMLLHEWTHSTIAWIYGYKASPFDIYYGDWTLLSAWELIDYKSILAEGKGKIVSIIAISPIILGGILYLLGVMLLSKRQIKNNKILWYFLFWFTLSNLGQVLDYIPIRTFTAYHDGLLRGDIGHFIQGLNLSPWIVFIPGTLFVVMGVWEVLKFEVSRAYVVMGVSDLRTRKRLLFLVLAYLFFWYGSSGFHVSFISDVFSCISILAVPVLFYYYNPAREGLEK